MVQNFAHFQQWCYPGAKGNYFADGEAEPRAEAACAVCAQKDYKEHRHKLSLFGTIPDEALDENADDDDDSQTDAEDGAGVAQPSRKPASHSMVKHKGVYYVQNPDKVQQLLKVKRYADRWPLIPVEELHASSVQHPAHPEDPEWRWLLHTRRVPVVARSSQPCCSNGIAGSVSQPAASCDGAAQPVNPAAQDLPPCAVSQPAASCDGAAQPVNPAAQDAPPCAGIGDPDGNLNGI